MRVVGVCCGRVAEAGGLDVAPLAPESNVSEPVS